MTPDTSHASDTRQHTEHRDFASPDDVRTFSRGRLEVLRVGGSEIGRLVLQPGWRWSEHVKPIAGTELCEAPHFQYHVAGTLRIKTADGTEFDATPGQVTSLPAGHDAWVVGQEDVVVVDWWGASNYAKLPTSARAAGATSRTGRQRLGQVRRTSEDLTYADDRVKPPQYGIAPGQGLSDVLHVRRPREGVAVMQMRVRREY